MINDLKYSKKFHSYVQRDMLIVFKKCRSSRLEHTEQKVQKLAIPSDLNVQKSIYLY